MSSSTLETLSDMIDYHKRELARLEIAFDVIASLPGKQRSAQALVEHRPGFTIKRTVSPEALAQKQLAAPAGKAKPAKVAGRKLRMEPTPGLRKDILDALAEGSATSAQMIKRLFPNGPHEAKNRVYQTLFTLKKEALVIKSERGAFSLTSQHKAAPGNGAATTIN